MKGHRRLAPYYLAMIKAILLPLTVLAMLACCFSVGAAAESLVPPGNSAASQYTEAFPTSKGEEDEQGKKKSGVTPAQVLGAGQAHQLEDKGPAGKAVAEFAAESSPTSVDASGGEETGSGNGDKKHAGKHGSQDNGAGGDGEEKSEGPGGGGGQPPAGGSGSGSGSGAAGAEANGSSGIGEVVSQATGISSGTLGLLLPLILLAVVIWSAAYVWRNRQQRVV
jgi:hypothetical protein